MAGDDIVARLRDCFCVPHGELCREAADEIARLRVCLHQFREDYSRCWDLLNEGMEHMDRLTKERDQARRKVCKYEWQADTDWIDSPFPMQQSTPRMFARLHGWDCFKEATDER